ncbi:DnaD domain-containing protein [Streptococcus hillyeri]|uniref:DnaD domain protein n=1 Tax=Streptococcus hillyeri TaxID=2282420 RepID=A0A3L9DW60_9STRE|nr:DnaD domain-containing protein [Streptococcus hillyeri]RLY05335.1 DnaD domain protein [Streptococcus hillyeri]
MSYLENFHLGNLVLPSALLFHFKELFSSADAFLVWQFFYLQNTTKLEEVAPSQIAQALGKTVTEVNRLISNLEKEGVLDVKTIELAGEIEVIFDATPALSKLDQLLGKNQSSQPNVQYVAQGEAIKQLTDDLEQAMGMLNPMILEDVQKLVYEDQTDPELIREALREAVFNNKVNWKYIQAILRNWRKEGIKTLRQVEERRLERERINPDNISVSDDFLSAMSIWSD